jgi:hypothetical protein
MRRGATPADDALANLSETSEAFLQAPRGPDHAAALGHPVAKRPLKRPPDLPAATREQLVDLVPRGIPRASVA